MESVNQENAGFHSKIVCTRPDPVFLSLISLQQWGELPLCAQHGSLTKCCCVGLYLPETAGVNLPDTLEDMKTFGKYGNYEI